jgi:hypothetical protein
MKKMNDYKTQNHSIISIKWFDILYSLVCLAFAKAPAGDVAPAGIEPASSESESEILSIEIRGQIE